MAEGSSKKKLFLIILIAIVLILIVIISAFIFLHGSSDSKKTQSKVAVKTVQEESDFMSSSQTDEIKLKDPLFTPVKEYTINLRDSRHFLTIAFQGALVDGDALSFLAAREPIVDDKVITYLHNLTTEDIQSRTGLIILKRELYKIANSIYTQKFIEDSKTKDRTPVKQILIKKLILN